MNPLTIIFLAIITYVIMFGRMKKQIYLNLLILYCFLEISNLKGNFAGESDFTRETFAGIVFFLYSIYYGYAMQIKIPQKIFYSAVAFLFVVLLSCLYEVVVPFEYPIVLDGNWEGWALSGVQPKVLTDISLESIVKPYIKVFIFTVSVVIMKTVCNREDYIFCIKRLLILSCLWIGYGYIEFFLKNMLGLSEQMHSLVNFMCGNGGENNPEGKAYFRDGSYSISGFTREPSHFSRSIYIFNLIALIYWKYIQHINIPQKAKIERNIKRYLVASLFIYIMSGSFSVVWYIFILGVFYLILKNELHNINPYKIIKLSVIMFALVAFIAAFAYYMAISTDTYFGERMNLTMLQLEGFAKGGAVMDVAGEHSSFVRFYSIIYVFENTLHRPFLGLSPDIQMAMDTSVTLFSYIGILGILAWWYFIYSGPNKLVKYDPWFILVFIFVGGTPLPAGNPINDVHIVLMLECTSLYCMYESSVNNKSAIEGRSNV